MQQEHNFDRENYVYQCYLKHEEIGFPAREYLKLRGINEDTIKAWKIGYCPIGHSQYKKLKGRITFPIFNQHGNMISISGRAIFNQKPKYDHYAFPATKVLFGLYINKESILEESRIIFTEGQLDVIKSWQNNLRNVVSTFGSHTSLDHFALASRYAKHIDIMYDNDEAGNVGAENIKKLSAFGDLKVEIKNILPPGEDLDSWFNSKSKKELMELLDQDPEMIKLKKKLYLMSRGFR